MLDAWLADPLAHAEANRGPGQVRIDARLRADQTGAPLGLHVLDAAGNPVAQFSLAADGYTALTDAGSWTDTAFACPKGVWLRVALVLQPSTGGYDVYVDDTRVGGGRLTAGSGTASQVRLRVQGGTGTATFAGDDLLVQPLA